MAYVQTIVHSWKSHQKLLKNCNETNSMALLGFIGGEYILYLQQLINLQ